jgi:hypothetical protein
MHSLAIDILVHPISSCNASKDETKNLSEYHGLNFC